MHELLNYYHYHDTRKHEYTIYSKSFLRLEIDFCFVHDVSFSDFFCFVLDFDYGFYVS